MPSKHPAIRIRADLLAEVREAWTAQAGPHDPTPTTRQLVEQGLSLMTMVCAGYKLLSPDDQGTVRDMLAAMLDVLLALTEMGVQIEQITDALESNPALAGVGLTAEHVREAANRRALH